MLRTNLMGFALSILLGASAAMAQDEAPAQTLFTNVHVFDGMNEERIENASVLVEGKLIKKVSKSSIEAPGATIIDGGGRTLMPGLIDSHVHLYLTMPQGRVGMESARWDTMASYGAASALDWFYDGFTTVRDMGGMANGLQQVIDKGLIEGPRIYLSGGVISQTAGHGDMRLESQSELEYSSLVRNGMNQTVDGPWEVRKAVRNNFNLGATQIKIMMAGGIASKASPFSSSQFTDEEVLAAVDEAATRGTYVAAHLYLDEHIKRALELGVMTIEHGQFLQEDTARLMKKKGAFISSFLASVQSDEILTHPVFGKAGTFENDRTIMMKEGSDGFAEVIRKVKPKLVFSSDMPSNSGVDARRQRDHEKWIFSQSFGNFEALKAMTSVGGELAMLTGDLNPYPNKLGVIEEGAYADILIVDGNPLEDISVLGGNSEWFKAAPRKRGIETIRVIMKDGVVHKNTVD